MVDPTQYRSFFEHGVDAFLVTTPKGRPLQVNQAACYLFGYDHDAFLQLEEFAFLNKDAASFAEFLQQLQNQGSFAGELSACRKNGDAFPVRLTAHLRHQEGESHLFLTAIDMASMQHQANTLKDSDIDLQTILEHTQEQFIIVDKELRVVNFNKITADRTFHLLGKTLKKGQSIFESASPERVPLLQQLYAEVLNGTVQHTSLELSDPSTGPVIINIRYAPIYHGEEVIGVIVTVKDTTALVERSKELLAANERFLYAAKATNDSIWDWDIVHDEVMRVGNGLQQLFGYDPVDANAEKGFWMKRVHPDDVERMLNKQTLVLQDPKVLYWEDEYKFQRADQTYAHVFDKGYIIRDEQGNALRMIGATKDISQQKASEALLLELNTRLKKRAEELANSNVELERFAYVASHDLQEPLRMINSFLQLLRKRYAGKIDHTADQYIRYAMDAAERMKHLIMDLLDYSRVGATAEELGMVDVPSLLHELVAVFDKGQTEQPPSVRMLTSHIPPIKANKTQLFQLFQNLVSNGLKYNKSEHPLVEISYEDKDTYHCFKVKDNGIGIEPSFHDKIFVLFQRLHSRTEYSGTGIGLAICKKIVDRHGGDIWIESPLEGGSEFCFTLSKSVS